MRQLLLAAVVTLAGCAAGPSYTWAPTTSATASLDQALARCDYETSAATQATDYSFRSSLGQELDRAIRKNDLMGKCMRAQGFQQVAVGAAGQASRAVPPSLLDQPTGPTIIAPMGK